MATTPGHYFDPHPASASRPHTVELFLPDVSLTLATDRGVFSGTRVDAGTKLLLLEGPPQTTPPSVVSPNPVLLDLGCGYGPIACTLAAREPAAAVWAVDRNQRAVALTAANAAANGLPNVRAVKPGDVPDDLRFDAIWSNPPIRVGKGALHELLTHWLNRLTPEGRAYLVVQKHLGADSLMAWLTDHGWPTTRLKSKQSYRILEVGRAE